MSNGAEREIEKKEEDDDQPIRRNPRKLEELEETQGKEMEVAEERRNAAVKDIVRAEDVVNVDGEEEHAGGEEAEKMEEGQENGGEHVVEQGRVRIDAQNMRMIMENVVEVEDVEEDPTVYYHRCPIPRCGYRTPAIFHFMRHLYLRHSAMP